MAALGSSVAVGRGASFPVKMIAWSDFFTLDLATPLPLYVVIGSAVQDSFPSLTTTKRLTFE